MAKSRAARKKDVGKPPTKRSVHGAVQRGRQDQEIGVTSRARKTRRPGERVADPRTGARPGSALSKWRPELTKANAKKRGRQTP